MDNDGAVQMMKVADDLRAEGHEELAAEVQAVAQGSVSDFEPELNDSATLQAAAPIAQDKLREAAVSNHIEDVGPESGHDDPEPSAFAPSNWLKKAASDEVPLLSRLASRLAAHSFDDLAHAMEDITAHLKQVEPDEV